ncbi:MAG: hypothetical protein N4A38_00790 [Candidatus Gracilibacteria bacterium]|nr:hypothetical protein [Candidatus Gracilibacteria bacterium]
MQKSKLFNVYLGVVSIFSILAIAINLGVILTMIGRFFIISDSEYIASRYSYRLDNCENDNVAITKTIEVGERNINTPKTKEEIEACKEEVRKDLITERRFRLKEDMITAGAWFIVFIFLFGFHYPKFKRYKEEDKK